MNQAPSAGTDPEDPGRQVPQPDRPRRFVADSRLLTFTLAAAVFGLDQITKTIVDAVLPIDGAHVGPIFHFDRIRNPGINFGLFRDFPIVILIATAVLGVAFVVLVLMRPPSRWWTVLGFGLLIGGGFGNVYDRLSTGAVFDFLNIKPFVGYLNLADLAIGAGIILLLLEAFLPRRRRRAPG